MVLIDTNIAVSLWIENNWTDAARRLLNDPEWRTEALALIEFGNVMATYVRTGWLASLMRLRVSMRPRAS
jgi:hypothetical protein